MQKIVSKTIKNNLRFNNRPYNNYEHYSISYNFFHYPFEFKGGYSGSYRFLEKSTIRWSRKIITDNTDVRIYKKYKNNKLIEFQIYFLEERKKLTLQIILKGRTFIHSDYPDFCRSENFKQLRVKPGSMGSYNNLFAYYQLVK